MKLNKYLSILLLFSTLTIITGCLDSGGSNFLTPQYDDSENYESLGENISTYSSLEFQMDEDINQNSLKMNSVFAIGNEKRSFGKIIYVAELKTIVFIPYKPLEENAEYTITLSGDIETESGSKLGDDLNYSFTTAAYIPETAGDIRVFCNYEAGYARKDLTLTFSTEEAGASIQTGWTKDLYATEPEEWNAGENFAFSLVDSYGTVKVFARVKKDSEIIGDNYSFTYKLLNEFPPVGDFTEGIHIDDECLAAWATDYSVTYGLDIDDTWKWETDDETGETIDLGAQILGPATGDNFDVLVIGNHGEVILEFESGISNGIGYDFVVYENGFKSNGGAGIAGDMFAELFFVEVSTNGTDFLRFDNVSLTSEPVGGYGTVCTGDVNGLGALQPNAYGTSYGTPFDLAWLRNKKEVLKDIVDLSNIRYVKLIDISGTDGTEGIDLDPDNDGTDDYYPCYDSFGNIIRDAFKTWGSGGADIDAVGVIHIAK
ncbi:MAG: Ig-like domain-containing protein [Spirochaetes bacterium]|nr:Ig-like domain-containing protein [Spirochaetota bacterium]